MVRIKKILCPVDFFPASKKAYDYALKLASNYNASVHALHVVSPFVSSAYDFPFNVSELSAALVKYSRGELVKLGKKAAHSHVRFSSEVLIGGIDAQIRTALKRTQANLVVMGTHGRRGIERWVLGSEADRLLRSCPVPLLIIRTGKHIRTAPPSIRNILVTTDFSSGAASAIQYAFSIARECQSRITILHVLDQEAFRPTSKMAVATMDAVGLRLEKLVPAGAREWCDVKVRVATGLPYETILKMQKSDRADLVVMNIHGKGFIDRALLGSTAERVIRGAECPVLLIPPQAKRKQHGSARSRVA